VTAGGTYTIDTRLSQRAGGGAFHIEIDGTDVTGSLTVPNTGSWTTWQTISQAGVALTAGTHVMRVVMDTDASSGYVANFNWFAVR